MLSATAENNGLITFLAEIRACGNRNQFLLLEVAAKKYLSSSPSSVASKQLFRSEGQIYADRRTKLNGENAERLLFLAYNIRLFYFCIADQCIHFLVCGFVVATIRFN